MDTMKSAREEFRERLSPEDWQLADSWNADALKVGIDQLQRLLDRLFTSKDGVATRAGVVLGAAAASLVAALDLVARVSGTSLLLVEIGAVTTVACVILSAVAYSMTLWDYVPDPQVLSRLLTEDKAFLQRMLILAMRDATVSDIRKLNRGGLLVNVSLVVLGVAIGLVGLAVFA